VSVTERSRPRIPRWLVRLGGDRARTLLTLLVWAGLDVEQPLAVETVQERLDRESARRRRSQRNPKLVVTLLTAVCLTAYFVTGFRIEPLGILVGFGVLILAVPRLLDAVGLRGSSSITIKSETSESMPMWTVDQGVVELRAHPLAADDLPDVHAALEAMVLAAGMPTTPVACVVETPAVNAFVLGGGAGGAGAIGVTRGLAVLLTKGELATVLAPLIVRLRRGSWEFGWESDAWFSEDTEALQLHRDPEAMLCAYRKVLDAQTMLPWAWHLGPATFFSYGNPLTTHVLRGKHPRLQRLQEILGAEAAE